ncbi:MAG: hypothetical protein LBD06_07910, partial [Candidatus Accumulibacter sp.]|nr:hypothetical protein [Accumulibacter sp.]
MCNSRAISVQKTEDRGQGTEDRRQKNPSLGFPLHLSARSIPEDRGLRGQKTEKPIARFFLPCPDSEDRGLSGQKTEKPIARFFLPCP